MNNTVKIPAPFESIASDKTVTYSLFIYDKLRKLDQETLNTTLLRIAEIAQEAADKAKEFNEDTKEAIKQLGTEQQEALELALTVVNHTKLIKALQTQLGGYTIVKTTEEEYEKMKNSGTIDDNTIYMWSEEVKEEEKEENT